MHLHKHKLHKHKIENHPLDLESSYPCPSCKQGLLIPITLTEAWGCDRCKQIFELKAEPNTIGKLTTPYPHQRQWQWDGKQWVIKKPQLQSTLHATVSWLKIVLLIVLFWGSWTVLDIVGLSVFLRALILLALVVMFWVILRR